MKTRSTLALAALTTLAVASPVLPSRTEHIHLKGRQANGTTSAPCAKVSSYVYGDGTSPSKQQVPAQLAWDCINDIPFNASSAKRLIEGIRPYIDWQSTLDVLKNPPAEYVEKVQPPVDIIGGLDQIDADIDAGNFKNEYDFGWTLYKLIQSAHDGHFAYVPDSVGSLFTWGRPIPLVSVSEDGDQLPAVFAFPDVLGMQFKNISYTPSPVVEIDGKDATEFLEELSQHGQLQDRDALYNNLFYELAQVSLSAMGSGTGTFTGGGRGRWVYPGATTTLTFANGSSHTMENYARPLIPLRNIATGQDLADKWLTFGSTDSTPKENSGADTAVVQVAGNNAPGYPTPIAAGYDMFKQLFPNIEPLSNNRLRAHEAVDLIGQATSTFASRFPREYGKNRTITAAQSSYFDYHTDVKVDGTPFSSWDEKMGPHEVNGALYTTESRWNLSDVFTPYSSGGIYVSGYGPLANVTGPPKFAPENIVLLTDGYCASTCTIFSELMTQQAGVTTIAMGGRSNKNPIQAIGGTKGVNNYQFGFIQQTAQYAITFDPSLNSSILREDYYRDIVYSRSAGSGVNSRDGLRVNDTSGVALQFIYEEADCRLYYTPEMTVDITAVWRAAADTKWGDKKCVAGGNYSDEKRDVSKVTTKLSPPKGRVRITTADAVNHVQAFENSFKLETECKLNGDGFMTP
ncbi:hypothetical protein GGP41_008997 [Bipolaris sorokiniana]|uniref:CPAF-like PDZ domain-containing protein n=1 Tax=Cochliobolus sativus TaxID=45130 RepID=A0A8H5ZEC0_COCSA|nr:hypothetical protein GGP41_008997 [Bipolaris sorokiniana]